MRQTVFSLLLVVVGSLGLPSCGDRADTPSTSAPKPNRQVRILDTQSGTNPILRITSATKDEELRAILLLHTPIGTVATNVLKFVLDELGAGDNTFSYYRFVDELQATRTGRLTIGRVDPGRPAILPEGSAWEQPHEIYAVLGTYSDGGLPCRVAGNWKFDGRDNLVEITIVKDRSP